MTHIALLGSMTIHKLLPLHNLHITPSYLSYIKLKSVDNGNMSDIDVFVGSKILNDNFRVC